MNPLVSIIIPVYNSHRTLYKCVDSVLNQLFKDWELLLIDDGSTDGSGKICEEYASKDKRIKVFHKENGGVSSARNLGIDNSNGLWLTFIDSDDWVENGYMSDLLLDQNIDFVATYYVAEGWKNWVSLPFVDRVYNLENMHYFLDECILKLIFPFGKLFKKDIIDKYKLRFDKKLSYGEDTLFVYNYLRYINSARVTSQSMYHYICNSVGSLSKERHSWSLYSDLIDLLCNSINSLEQRFEWDGCYVRYICVRDIYKRYLNFLKEDNLLRSIRELRSVCKNNNVLESLKYSLDEDLTLKRRIFNIMYINKMYLFCAIILYFYRKL